MSPVLGQRLLATGAAAVLGVVIALALAHQSRGGASGATALPEPAATSQSDWYRALVGVERKLPTVSACGVLRAGTLGIAHPVLPCGTKVYLAFRDKRVLTQVVERGKVPADREFELTPALAKELGLTGTEPIRWTYARR